MKIGTPVRIKTDRPHLSHLNGCVGELVGIISTKQDIAVVTCGRYSLNFWLEEIEAIAPATKGDVQT